MVEIKTTRDFRVDGDDYIAIKKDEYENGKGKKVVRILEEHNITVKEIDDVIDNLFQAELTKFDEEKVKKLKEVEDIKEEIADVIKTDKYLAFKDLMADENTLKFMDVMSREKILKASERLLQGMIKQREDIIAWETQFKDLKRVILLNK